MQMSVGMFNFKFFEGSRLQTQQMGTSFWRLNTYVQEMTQQQHPPSAICKDPRGKPGTGACSQEQVSVSGRRTRQEGVGSKTCSKGGGLAHDKNMKQHLPKFFFALKVFRKKVQVELTKLLRLNTAHIDIGALMYECCAFWLMVCNDES